MFTVLYFFFFELHKLCAGEKKLIYTSFVTIIQIKYKQYFPFYFYSDLRLSIVINNNYYTTGKLKILFLIFLSLLIMITACIS